MLLDELQTEIARNLLREPHARGLQLVEPGDRDVGVVHERGFGHLEREIVRRQPGLFEDPDHVGDEARIKALVGAKTRGIEIVHAATVIGMDEHPSAALRRRDDTSIGVATRLVKDGAADAVVSAGNTGATMAAALLILGRIRGIDRPALCGMLPVTSDRRATCLLDAGATMDADARNLLQYARMATAFTVVKRHYRAIVVVGGVILIVMGVLIVTGEFKQLNIQAQSWSSNLGLEQ